MKQHLKALLIVIVIGAGAIWGFQNFFMTKVNEKPTESISLEMMKTNGAPNIKAQTISGEEFELNALKGQVVILNFWASWCGPCVEEVPSLLRLADTFKGRVKIIAISEDSNLEDIQSFLKSFPKLNGEFIKIIFDQDHSLMKKFGINQLPESLILDKDHKVAKKVIGSIDWSTQDAISYIDSLVTN